MLRVHTVWRVDELQRINATSEGAERKAALYALLEQEAQLIASIGQHRLAAGREGKDRAKHSFLNAVSSDTLQLRECWKPGG